jgi:hypothetical protein
VRELPEDLYLDEFRPDGWYPQEKSPVRWGKRTGKGFWCHICGTTDEERFFRYMMPNTCIKCIEDLRKRIGEADE